MSSLNAQYLTYLAKYPLLTKSVTAGVLAALNEIIATVVAADNKKEVSRFKSIFNKKVLTKVLIMVFYGSCLLTPTSHYLYGVLNQVYKGPLSLQLKIAQVLTSLSTITPILLAMFTLWISLINGYKVPESKDIMNFTLPDFNRELYKIKTTIASGLQKNYFSVVKSSAITSMCVVTIAQNFIRPELWVVFFNVVYFFLGTAQNSMMKIRQRNAETKKNIEEKETAVSTN